MLPVVVFDVRFFISKFIHVMDCVKSDGYGKMLIYLNITDSIFQC